MPKPRRAATLSLTPFPKTFTDAAQAGLRLAKAAAISNVYPMQSHELLREVFQKCSAKHIAAEMELSLSTIYKWAEPDEAGGSGTANPLDRIEALIKCTDDPRIVQWICQCASGYFVHNPRIERHSSNVISGTNEIVQDFADLLAVIATATADNQISPSEAEAIRARWEELKSVTEEFVVCAEVGNFAALKERLQK